MKIKRTVAVLLGVMFLLSQGIVLSAQSQAGTPTPTETYVSITPFWTNVNSITLDMEYDNGNLGCFGFVVGAAGTTSINATFTLARRTIFGFWTTVQTWTSRTTGSSLTFWETTSASSGNTYRLSVTATVVRNGVSETVSTSFEQRF